MNSLATPASIPAYAHPVHVGADGIRRRNSHGPRTQAATERRAAITAEYLAVLAARAKNAAPVATPAEYLAVAR